MPEQRKPRARFQYDPERNTWERQPGEGKQPFYYFALGLELPPRKRTVSNVYDLATERAADGERVCSHQRMHVYSSEHDWSRRWDDHAAERFREWDNNHAADRMGVAFEFAEQLKTMQQLTGLHLAMMMDTPGMVPDANFAKLLTAATGLFKAIYGAAPEKVHHSGPGGGPVRLDFAELDQLTPEELAARVRQLTGQDLPPGYGPDGG